MCEAHACTLPADADRSTIPTIGEIFRLYGPAYREKYAGRMSYEQLQVMSMLERCRTGELGGALYRCEVCARYHATPRSCGNRHCPRCQGHKAKQWLEKQVEKLLPCPYFLITFTVPKELRRFVRSHRRECYRALFETAAATLIKLAKDPKYLGSSRLGFTGVLHSWGRSLTFHPHVHFIVPGGAISEDGENWLSSGVDFFVPVKAASIIYRAKFKELMEDAGLIDQIPAVVWTKNWVVNSKAVGDGRKALRYLAPYVYRVAISNRRIVKCEPGRDGLGRVSFTYRPSGSQCYRVMTLTAEKFIRRRPTFGRCPTACPATRFSKGAALWLRAPSSPDRSGVVENAGDGDTELGLCAVGDCQASADPPPSPLSALWRPTVVRRLDPRARLAVRCL